LKSALEHDDRVEQIGALYEARIEELRGERERLKRAML
jgi:hypothetical protein